MHQIVLESLWFLLVGDDKDILTATLQRFHCRVGPRLVRGRHQPVRVLPCRPSSMVEAFTRLCFFLVVWVQTIAGTCRSGSASSPWNSVSRRRGKVNAQSLILLSHGDLLVMAGHG